MFNFLEVKIDKNVLCFNKIKKFFNKVKIKFCVKEFLLEEEEGYCRVLKRNKWITVMFLLKFFDRLKQKKLSQ